MGLFQFLQNEYFNALLIIILAVIAAKILEIVLKRFIQKIVDHTSTDLDNILLRVIAKPVRSLIFVFGLYLAAISLSVVSPYITWINRALFITVTLILSIIASKIISVLIGLWLKVQKRYQKTPQVLNKIISVIIYLIAMLVVLDHFEIQVSPLIATLGIGGLAVGLALQNKHAFKLFCWPPHNLRSTG